MASAASVSVSLAGGTLHDPDGARYGRSRVQTGYLHVTVVNTSGMNAAGDFTLGNSFLTFCLKVGASHAGAPELFAVDPGSLGGGSSTNAAPLSSQTAYLYTHFRAGTLGAVPGVAGFNPASDTDLDALQDAIWWFQGQIGSGAASGALGPTAGSWSMVGDDSEGPGLSLSARARALIDAANAAVASREWVGTGNVRVLSFGTEGGEGGFNQDIITLTPIVPLPHAVGLAGAALVGLGLRRRRPL